MPNADSKSGVFEHLAALFAPYRDDLGVKTDEPGHVYLNASPSPSNPKGLFFGAVKIGKRYVSFRLMPVNVHPELLDGISPGLRKRMQGKSCFNFAAPDETLFAELENLTRAGIEAYERDGAILASPNEET